MERYYVGFDAGTQGVKVSVYDSGFDCIAQAANSTTLSYPGPCMVEMDPDEYLALTVKGIRECTDIMRAEGRDPAGIRSVFGDGIICGITGVDANGDSITPFINYLDSRTQADADSINAKNLDIWGEQTGNADASCMFPAMFARWFNRNIPDFERRAKKYVHNAPYVLMHLAGLSADEAFIDQGAMSGWGLGYDVMKKRWSQEQLDILGLNPDMFPRIVKPWDVIGHLTEEMSLKTGLPAGIPVCGGAGDTMQSMLGCGLFGPGLAADVAGTCSMFCVSTDGILPDLTRHGSELIFNSGSMDDTYFYWGYIRTGGLALRWYKDSVCAGESYDALTAGAAEVRPGSNGVMFLPYLTGGVGDMSDASGCFLNMGLDTDRFTLWRSVLEAIGFDYMTVTDQYRSAGVDLSRITVAEGGSANDLWNQIKADMMGSQTVVMKTRGGAMMTDCAMAAYAAGDVQDLLKILDENTEVDRSFEPRGNNTVMYRNMYDIRENIINGGMSDVFRQLSPLR